MHAKSLMEVQPNMEVFTSDAAHIGRIKQIRQTDFLVDRSHARDIYVPLTLVSQVLDSERRVELTMTEEDVSQFDWDHPPLM